MPAVKRRRFAEYLLFARVLPPWVERGVWGAVEHIAAGGVDVGKIRA